MNITIPIQLAVELWLYKTSKTILYWLLDYEFNDVINAYLNKSINLINESKIDAYEYLSDYIHEYLEEDSIKRIKENAVNEWENHSQYLWKAVYDIIHKWDNTAEYEAWYISWLREAITLLTK